MNVLVAITFLLMSSFQKGNCEEPCQTKSCLETGVRVLNSMNETVHPCEDFFEFACRGWITNNPIPKHAISWSTQKVIEEEIELKLYRILNTPDKAEDGRPIKMARALYRSCMRSTGLGNIYDKLLTDTLKKLGLSKSPPTDKEGANLNISKIAGTALRHHGIMIFVDAQLRKDSNSSIYRLELKQLSPQSNNFDVYLRDPIRFKTTLKRQKNYIQLMMRVVGMKNKGVKYATEIMNFTTKIANIMAPPEVRAMKNYTHQVMTISELQNLTDPDAKHWNWTTYMNALFEQTDVIVEPKIDTVYIHDMGYYKGLPSLLSEISPGIIARYVWWEVYFKLTLQTAKDSRDYSAQFGKYAYSNEPTWYGCTNLVKKIFDMALTAAYVEKHFNAQNKKTATEMWTDLSSSFDEMLTEYKWIDDKTKARAHRKLKAMNASMAYPEWITDREKLEEHFKEYEGFSGSLVDMYRNLKSDKKKQLLNRWKQTTTRKTWPNSGTEVNTRYTPSTNIITIGSGVLHEPLYGNAAEALNYGALGALMGHELTHGFDVYGQQYSEIGTIRKWWSPASLKHYDEKVDCVMIQYSGFNVTQLGKKIKLDGLHTRDENVADMGGLAVAFRAYKKLKARSQPQPPIAGLAKYTDEQLFFLGYAQMFCDNFKNTELRHFIRVDRHSPGRFRVNGALQNSNDFAKVWNCPPDSAMNPEKKCTVW